MQVCGMCRAGLRSIRIAETRRDAAAVYVCGLIQLLFHRWRSEQYDTERKPLPSRDLADTT